MEAKEKEKVLNEREIKRGGSDVFPLLRAQLIKEKVPALFYGSAVSEVN